MNKDWEVKHTAGDFDITYKCNKDEKDKSSCNSDNCCSMRGSCDCECGECNGKKTQETA